VKIVLSRLDRIGDLVLSTPAIASVRRSWPDAHVTIVCSARNYAVVEHSPDVDAIVVAPSNVKPAAVGARFEGVCDLALALAPCAPDFELVRATRAPKRFGYTYVRRYLARATAPLFLTGLAISEADPDLCERDPAYRVRHEVEQVLDVVRLAGATTIAHELTVRISDADRAAVADLPRGAIVVQLGARWFSGGSTLDLVIDVLRRLQRFERPIVVTSGAETAREAAAIRASGAADHVVSDLAFGPWAAVLERARLVVTIDTGATHVASAMGRPCVVVFERRWFRLSSQEWAPYRVPAVLLCKPPDESAESLASLRENVLAAAESLLTRDETVVPV
jgi:ADP-heptose:LPS heptosyltransferase